VHVPVVGEVLHVEREVEVAEPRHVPRGVDMQRAVGGGPVVVVPVTPHAADLRADLEQGDVVEPGFGQVFGAANTRRAGADDGDALCRHSPL
jgi:hypothetical protein